MGLVTAQYTVFSEGAARHFCLVGETAPAIYQAGAAPLTGGELKEAAGDQEARAEVRQHQVRAPSFEGRALVGHTQSVREKREPRHGWTPEPEFLERARRGWCAAAI